MKSQDSISINSAARIGQTRGRHSLLEESLRKLPISVCSVFVVKDGRINPVSFKETDVLLTSRDHALTLTAFPRTSAKTGNIVLEATSSELPKVTGKRIAVLFSGGPAAGGHNVLAGLRAILGKDNTLLGIRKGTKGLLSGDMFEITLRDVQSISVMSG